MIRLVSTPEKYQVHLHRPNSRAESSAWKTDLELPFVSIPLSHRRNQIMTSRIFGNGTNIVHWEASPQTRGTWDILSSCIITLILCVWTAVHLNISPPGSFWEPKLRKVGWLILALLAPEMVAYTAWYV